MNINDEDFVTKFDPSVAVVGQVGFGYIGKAVYELFKDTFETLIYDKFMPDTATLDQVVKSAHVVFIAVPTPMDKATGECHTGIVESVLQDIQNAAVKVGRDLADFVVVIKSTVPVGFTRKMQERFALRVVFSPEFLTEANSVNDFKTASRVLFGGAMEDAVVAVRFFQEVWKDRLTVDTDNPLGPVVLAQCEPEVAEMVKLTTNGFLMTKVLFFNEIYQLCGKLGVDFDEVRILSLLDWRIGQSHTAVPGPDGHLGAGGSCFPKDINSLRHIAKANGVPEKLFTAVIERNESVRPERDWEGLKGRAVTE